MAPQIHPVDVGAQWAPNAPQAVLTSDDYGTTQLALNCHFDDPDKRTVVLRFTGCIASLHGPYNDEARHLHPLYETGLKDLLWIGEVADSEWLPELVKAVHPRAAERVRHFVLPLKEGTVEVAAGDVQVLRVDLPTREAAASL